MTAAVSAAAAAAAAAAKSKPKLWCCCIVCIPYVRTDYSRYLHLPPADAMGVVMVALEAHSWHRRLVGVGQRGGVARERVVLRRGKDDKDGLSLGQANCLNGTPPDEEKSRHASRGPATLEGPQLANCNSVNTHPQNPTKPKAVISLRTFLGSTTSSPYPIPPYLRATALSTLMDSQHCLACLSRIALCKPDILEIHLSHPFCRCSEMLGRYGVRRTNSAAPQ